MPVTSNTGKPGPAFPGDAYEFTFTASSGDRLGFATMFVQSNDLFFATPPEGIAFWSEINLVADGFSYPDTNTVIKVTIASSK